MPMYDLSKEPLLGWIHTHLIVLVVVTAAVIALLVAHSALVTTLKIKTWDMIEKKEARSLNGSSLQNLRVVTRTGLIQSTGTP